MTINDFQVMKRGTITRITGKPGAGKTHGALMFIERTRKRFLQEGKHWPYKVLTNIIIDWDQDPKHFMRNDIIQVTSLRTLYWQILEGQDFILVLDEAGLFGSSGAAGVRKHMGQWEMVLKLCRKLGMSIIWIDQRGKGSIPPTVRDLASWHIHKPSKGAFILKEVLYTDDGRDAVERTRGKYKAWGGVTIPFDTHAPGSFDMELGEKAVIKNKREVWVPITTADVYDAIKSCKQREIRPTLKAFLKLYAIPPDRTDTQANYRERVHNEEEQIIREGGRRGPSPVHPGIVDNDKAAVYAIIDRHRAKGLKEMPLPREIQAALPWMYASTVSRYILNYCQDKGLTPPSRSGGTGIRARSFKERVKETREKIKENKAPPGEDSSNTVKNLSSLIFFTDKS
jgi:hypothetical protein